MKLRSPSNLNQLPERIKQASIARAVEIDYPVEVVVEMALAGYLVRSISIVRGLIRNYRIKAP